MGELGVIDLPEKAEKLDLEELSQRVANSQKRIEEGVANDQDYIEFNMCQLELAERGILK